MSSSSSVQPTSVVPLRSVALPNEHGGWGFLLEPIILGLLVAPSTAGLGLAVSAVSVFLMHHPLQIVLKDRVKGRRFARTRLAERVVLAYAVMAGLPIAMALALSPTVFWLPLVIGFPFALVQMIARAFNHQRDLLPELAGTIALGATAPAMAIAAGWEAPAAFLLWLPLVARAIPSVVYVRARLRLERNERAPVRLALGLSLAAVLLTTALANQNLGPTTAIVAMLVLLARAAHGLSRFRASVRARTVGFQEMAFGLITVILVALGYRG